MTRTLSVLRVPVRAVLMLVLLVVGVSSAQASPDHDLWYVLDFQGTRAGWMHDAQVTSDGVVTTSRQTLIEIKRGRVPIRITMSDLFVESPTGTLLTIRSEMNMGSTPIVKEFRFTDDGVEVTTSQGDASTTSSAPIPDGPWLSPAAASDFVSQRLASGAETILYAVIEPSVGLAPVSMTYTVLERTNVETAGKTVPAYKCGVRTSAMPGITSVEYLDVTGLPIRSELDLGAMKMTILAADKALALAELDPPELMQSTFVRTSEPIKHARHTTHGVYVLSLPAGEIADLPTTGAQSISRVDDRTLRVVVTSPGGRPADDADREAYLRSCSMIDCTDAKVVELSKKATRRSGDDPEERAEAMRRFVHRYINAKNLGVGFASASEVARTREGDCSEHGVLLAALLRADGIPSRVVSGVLYVDQFIGAKQIFGYHMWTQALLDIDGKPTWVDLDATLPDQTPFDATHIALSVSALEDGSLNNDLVRMVPLLGRLSIRVESVE